VPRKPKPLPLPELPHCKRRFDTILTALLAVKKDELQKIEDKLKEVRKERERRTR
jgi:hypothetical protein